MKFFGCDSVKNNNNSRDPMRVLSERGKNSGDFEPPKDVSNVNFSFNLVLCHG